MLSELAKEEDNDELLFLLDLGTAYFRSGQYPLAVETFLKAEKMAEIQDYTSISAEAASVLLSDEVKPYQGEDFEKILINAYLAMAFTFQPKWDSALVECRKVNHKIGLMISEGKLPYKRNYFAKYLAGTLFEARGELNDAFVDYRQLYKWQSSLALLDVPLLRMASRLGATQEFQQYRKAFGKNVDYKLGPEMGEIILLVEQGKGPIKVPDPRMRLLPMFQKRPYRSAYVEIRDTKSQFSARSHTFFDIESTAIRQLELRTGKILAKKLAGVAAKELVAHQVGKETESPFLGALTSLILHAQDQADLRSWSTLPARLQIARVRVPAGRHDVVLDMVLRSGGKVKAQYEWKGVEVKPGQLHFLNYQTPD